MKNGGDQQLGYFEDVGDQQGAMYPGVTPTVPYGYSCPQTPPNCVDLSATSPVDPAPRSVSISSRSSEQSEIPPSSPARQGEHKATLRPLDFELGLTTSRKRRVDSLESASDGSMDGKGVDEPRKKHVRSEDECYYVCSM